MDKKSGQVFISIFCILLAGAIHVLDRLGFLVMHVNTTILGLYTVPILLWIEKNKKAALQQYMKKYLTYIGYTLILYLLVRTIKYEIALKGSSLDRYLWYSYYIFIMAIGIFLMFAVLYIDKSEDEKIDRKWNLLYLPLVVLSILCISNDYHQKIFFFPRGIGLWSDHIKDYGFVFFLILIFGGLLIIGVIGVAMIKLLDRRNLKSILLTFAVVAMFCLYTYFYIYSYDTLYWLFVAYKSPEFNTLIVMMFIESLIYNRLIPTNKDYERFWMLSSLKIGIMDHKGNFHYGHSEKMNVDRELILKAENNPIALDDNTLIESARISAGWSYWLSDISELNAIKQELQDFANIISEENELLQAENRLKKESAGIKKQIEIYKFIDKNLEDKLVDLEKSLENLPADEAAFREAMKFPTITEVYIKRYSNMLLLSKKSPLISLTELRLAIEESLEYLKFFNIMTVLIWEGESLIHAEKLLLTHQAFQEYIERHIFHMTALIVSFKEEEDRLRLSLQIENPEKNAVHKTLNKSTLKADRFLSEEFIEANVLYVNIQIPLGDDIDDIS